MHGADNIDPIEVAVVEVVLIEGTRGFVDGDQVTVDQSHLESIGVEVVILGVVEARVASEVGHVQIDVDELFGETFNYVQISPISEVVDVLGRQMDFHDEVVNVVEIFDRQSPQSGPLSSFNVDLHRNVLAFESARVDQILQRGVIVVFLPLCSIVEAHAQEYVFLFALFARSRLVEGTAVELIVRHGMLRSNIAAEPISAFNAEIEQGFTFVQNILAQKITAIFGVSVAFYYAARVLYIFLGYIIGFEKEVRHAFFPLVSVFQLHLFEVELFLVL